MFFMKIYVILTLCLGLTFFSCKSKSSLANNQCDCWTQTDVNNPVSTDLVKIEPLNLEAFKYDFNNVLPSAQFLHQSALKHLTAKRPTLAQSLNVLEKAFDFEGVRYRRGGTSNAGMDCSGLVYTCFSVFGITLPRSSTEMANSVSEISKDEVRAGDLIFFRTSRRNRINHVGLVIEKNGKEIKFIHASIKKGVIVSSTSENYYARTYAKVGRVLKS